MKDKLPCCGNNMMYIRHHTLDRSNWTIECTNCHQHFIQDRKTGNLTPVEPEVNCANSMDCK